MILVPIAIDDAVVVHVSVVVTTLVDVVVVDVSVAIVDVVVVVVVASGPTCWKF